MKSASFECEVITPMFMSGADRRSSELRPSEFKGMMRFWWRAIRAEAIRREEDIKKLREEEAKMFGGTEEGKSKLLIRIIPLSNTLLPNKGRFNPRDIKPGYKFQISLITYYDSYWETFKNLFLLSLILGGFGKRARRGRGSVKIRDQKDIDLKYIADLLNSISPDSFQIQNGKIVNKRKIVNKKEGGAYPWIKEIEIGRGSWHKWDDLLRRIDEASRRFKDPSLGFINRKGKPRRMASPIYVSVVEKNASLCPIITTLNSAFPPLPPYLHPDYEKQEEFKKFILQGVSHDRFRA